MALAAMRRFCSERSLLEDETCASCDSLFYIGTIQRAIAVSRRSWPARPLACPCFSQYSPVLHSAREPPPPSRMGVPSACRQAYT